MHVQMDFNPRTNADESLDHASQGFLQAFGVLSLGRLRLRRVSLEPGNEPLLQVSLKRAPGLQPGHAECRDGRLASGQPPGRQLYAGENHAGATQFRTLLDQLWWEGPSTTRDRDPAAHDRGQPGKAASLEPQGLPILRREDLTYSTLACQLGVTGQVMDGPMNGHERPGPE